MVEKCLICKKCFSKYSNLRMHVKRFHSDKLDEIAPKKVKKITAVCNECGKTFSKNSNLTQHVKKFHSDKINELINSKAYNYECKDCGRHFTQLRNFKSHNKIHLGDRTKTHVLCNLCSEENLTESDIINHFQAVHDIEVKSDVLHFLNYEQFSGWKSQMEKETNSYFINRHGSYQTKEYKQLNYMCHRSGFYQPKGRGLRYLKMQGTKKINGHCPAKINLKIFVSGKCEANFINCHVGHTDDLCHLNLNKSEKDKLASKIAAKIPFPKILDEIRDSISDKLERVHLLSKKDLYNIEQSYNLNKESVRHKNDAVSVDAWVREVEETGCILFYKPQDTLSDLHPQLNPQDFFLIIMNKGQKDILEKYGNDVVCIDGTHGINSYEFELVTLLILDDMREGFPGAFCISNRTDEAAMKVFFYHIHNALGIPLKPKTFMSDMASSFYNAWIEIMGPVKFRLYCSWHVDRAWRKNLSKIASKEKQVSVYKQLRTLLHETDINAFNIMCSNFLSSLLSDPETTDFGHYFQKQYVESTNTWAYCYRLNSGINTNMFLERMHRTLKYIYMNGKVNKRLDCALGILMKFIRDKLFDRLIVINKGKVTSKIKSLRDRHKKSENLDCKSILETDQGWQVPSSSSNRMYLVEDRQLNCSCKLICTNCKVCFHRFSCTCLDSSIKWNMCKHVHLICKFLKEHGVLQPSIDVTTANEADNNILIIDENVPNYEEEKILEAPAQGKESLKLVENLEFEKGKLKSQLNEVIDNITSYKQLEAFKKLMAPAEPTIAAIANEEKIISFAENPNKKTPHNKNIERQRRLYKTKKKTHKTSNQLAQPDATDMDTIAIKLLYANQ